MDDVTTKRIQVSLSCPYTLQQQDFQIYPIADGFIFMQPAANAWETPTVLEQSRIGSTFFYSIHSQYSLVAVSRCSGQPVGEIL